MTSTTTWRLGVFSALAALATASCGGDPAAGSNPNQAGDDARFASVGFDLVPVSGLTINTVHYLVTRGAAPALTVSEGDLPTPGSGKDYSFGLSLPVGTGYTISLSAVSGDPSAHVTCGGSYGPFDVAPNNSTGFTLSLTCVDQGAGQIQAGAGVQTDACPRLLVDYVLATPARRAYVGSPIALAAKAHDLDGKAVTYSWTTPTDFFGTFAPKTGATTTFTCATLGFQRPLTVIASNGECAKSVSTLVSCIFAECGNGIVEPGETCDTGTVCAPGAVNCIPGNQCPSDCSFICGDGVAEPPAEDCDPGNTPTCDSTCHFR